MLQNEHTTFGLSPRDHKAITDILVKYTDVAEVHIFGSRANGNYKPFSDIDLAVMNEGVSDHTIMQIRVEFEDSSLPYKVDLINYPSLTHSELKEHIARVGKPFYKWG